LARQLASMTRSPVVLETRPDITMMDVRLPDGNGIDATAEIRAQWPQAKVIMLTSYSDDTAVLAMIQVGAAGFVLKHVLAQDLLQSVSALWRPKSAAS
jgi:two-component system response regulator DevR